MQRFLGKMNSGESFQIGLDTVPLVDLTEKVLSELNSKSDLYCKVSST